MILKNTLSSSKIKVISYIGVVADLFHYGHLRSIKFAKSISDYNICGVLTDEAVEDYRVKPISNLKERKEILESLNCVDRVMIQHSRDATENLKKIHSEFPHAKIVIVHGDELNYFPEEEYLRTIGGEVVLHSYYKKLSNFKIMNNFIENKDNFKDLTRFSSLINISSGPEALANKVIISSKADTLKSLQPLLTKSEIEPMYVFDFSDWKNLKSEVLDSIQKKFKSKIVVRSSSTTEDTLESSMAGCFESILNIDASERIEVENAIDRVVHSFSEKGATSSFNQILVQKQTEDILMSGVVFTRILEKNSPYYVINYDESGSSTSVTSGKENKTIIFSRFSDDCPPKFQKIIDAIKEIEHLIPVIPLDIEFALTRERMVIFQVRPLAANINKPIKDEEIREKINSLKAKFLALNKQNHLAGKKTFVADMPDWNPAEIIGDNPNYLDYSLYDYLITNSAWHEARTSQGYYNVAPAKLVELFGNKPYVNVRNTFNSFTPANIAPELREKLVEFYLNTLEEKPNLQDKVEFEILFTCIDLSFNEKIKALKNFSEREIHLVKQSLLDLTNNLVSNSFASIRSDMKKVREMEEKRKIIMQKNLPTVQDKLNAAKALLDECRKNGTVQFSKMARLAFIAKILLKSLVQQQIMDISLHDKILNSIKTIASEINDDFQNLIEGKIDKKQFICKYYHLRPGTYNIMSARYDKNPDLLKNINLVIKNKSGEDFFEVDAHTAENITAKFRKAGLLFDSRTFFMFLKEAIPARELSKFEFTKNLSDALELIAAAGEMMGFTRKEISRLGIEDILNTSILSVHEITKAWRVLIKNKEKEMEINEHLQLPSIIFSEKDFDVIEHYKAKPNFITQKSVEGKIVHIKDNNVMDIEGNVVLLENGDPGYDWVFTRNPAGLITKYGGIASHMAIRCAEFSIPAAIGCGELIFNKLKIAEKVLIDGKNRRIEPT